MMRTHLWVPNAICAKYPISQYTAWLRSEPWPRTHATNLNRLMAQEPMAFGIPRSVHLLNEKGAKPVRRARDAAKLARTLIWS
ncbi:hypothetical protein MPL1032_180140 [Mesorhizobium plurifarium]|uniref:Uncharacterized protein n=1 Tax=Mesorhizobium plurifarium TaxID=69974 RepID=A0A0K2VUC6_MESPL|nr:hypothetical protein MPL1032_180140 [Mesorhizobium plurifarium]